MPAITLQRSESVATLTLARATIHNAFDDVLIAELIAALDTLAVDPALRVLVLTGDGRSFSAGADLAWMQRMAQASEQINRDDAAQLARLMRTLDEFPRPTIARVNGAAFGGGVGLVACCDIAIGVPEAKFGLTETKLGLVPAVISPYVIAAIGARQARRWFLTAGMFDAAEAHRIGLLHLLVPASELDAAVAAEVSTLLAAGPIAVAEAKHLIRRVTHEDSSDTVAQDAANAALIARLRVSDEGQEGLAAFFGKRKARWVG
jgi:methylglutaconyl-CoA hydratase